MSRCPATPDGLQSLRHALSAAAAPRGLRPGRAVLDVLEPGRLPALHVGGGTGSGGPSRLRASGPGPAGGKDSGADPPRSEEHAVEEHAVEEHAVEEPAASSQALVTRAQSGDGEAFGALYDQYVDMVYRYVLHRVGDRQVAEDLTSETFLRALRRLSSFTWQGRDIGAWFVTIARNLVADHYKSSRYRLELTTDDVAQSGAPPVVEGPEGEVLASLENAVLLDAVRRLGPEQQECVALRFLQGLSVQETALVMGKNDGAVKALQYRAVKALGRLLPEDLRR